MNRYRFFAIDQPMGRFYVASINASEIIPISQSYVRTPYNDTGIQRKLNDDRVKDIAKYCESEDAMFPTPIILSGRSEYFSFYVDMNEDKIDFSNLNNGFIEIDVRKIIENGDYLSIVDGQHRLAGIEASGNAKKFDLLVMFIFDTEAFQDAEIFSVINKNQKQVSASLVYDLYGLSNTMTVEKFAHEIVKWLNISSESRLKSRIKMLGYKTDNFDDTGERIEQYVSQAAIAYEIIQLTSFNRMNDNNAIKNGDYLNNVDSDNKVLRVYLANDHIVLAATHVMAFFNKWIERIEKQYDEKSIMFKTVVFIAAFEIFKQIKIKNKSIIEKIDNEVLCDIDSYDYGLDEEVLEKIENIYGYEINKLQFDLVDTHNISSSRSGALRLARDLLESSKLENNYT